MRRTLLLIAMFAFAGCSASTEEPAQTATQPATPVTQSASAPEPSDEFTPHLVEADTATYSFDGGVGFTTPSEKFLCGRLDSTGLIGCQARVVVAGADCGDDPNLRSAMVSWSVGEETQAGCTTQGVFGFPGSETPVLGYDTKLDLGDGVTCEVAETGTTCYDQTHRFSISDQGIDVES